MRYAAAAPSVALDRPCRPWPPSCRRIPDREWLDRGGLKARSRFERDRDLGAAHVAVERERAIPAGACTGRERRTARPDHPGLIDPAVAEVVKAAELDDPLAGAPDQIGRAHV